LIVVDSSALVAIFLEEPRGPDLLARIAAEPSCLLSAANYVEAGHVLARRNRDEPALTLTEFDTLLRRLQVAISPLDEPQARLAVDARIRYGRGFGHPARLNFGDCFAYALAKTRNLPLLYVGDNFTHTDIISALV
jgi:ribonuclease VapC